MLEAISITDMVRRRQLTTGGSSMQRCSDQRGFSLFELLVVMGVMLVITGATMSLMRDSVKVSNVTYQLADAQQSLRAAHESLNRDLVSAGDGLLGLNSIQVSRSFITSYLTTSPVCGSPSATMCPLTVMTSDDLVPTNTTVAGITPAVTVRSTPTSTDRLTTLQLDTAFTEISLAVGAIVSSASGYEITVTTATYDSVNLNDIYFFTSSAGQTLGTVKAKVSPNKLRFFTSDAYSLNTTGTNGSLKVVAGTPAAGASTLPVSMTRLLVIHYFVGNDGLLYRRVFGQRDGTNGYRDSVIAEHVTNLQFRYILKSTSGAAQPMVAQLTTGTQQAAVRQVEVTVSTETTHPIIKNQRQELSMTSSTAVRNVQFREALQPNASGN
jgi:prepilin-type N-terminal cleavage/methylation domain-containing protein